eukprot:7973-Heterococcus_DN1.PRE.4
MHRAHAKCFWLMSNRNSVRADWPAVNATALSHTGLVGVRGATVLQKLSQQHRTICSRHMVDTSPHMHSSQQQQHLKCR